MSLGSEHGILVQGSSSRDLVLALPHFVRRQKKRDQKQEKQRDPSSSLLAWSGAAVSPVTTLLDVQADPRVLAIARLCVGTRDRRRILIIKHCGDTRS